MKKCSHCRYRPSTSSNEYCLMSLRSGEIKAALSGRGCSGFKWPLDNDGNEVTGDKAYLYYEESK